MNSILKRIAEHKKQEIKLAKQEKPLQQLVDQEALPVRDFITGLQLRSPAIIAEIKKASPTKGLIRPDFNVATIAETYEQYGANCISVITDTQFFQGSPDYIAVAKTHSLLPVLRKDFIIDPYQIHESRALGADCILLIMALMDDKQLQDYCQLAQELKMAVLIESHTLQEFERALKLPTPLMGVNNRSLHTFTTNVYTSIELAKYLPDDRILISESGINTHDDIKLMQDHGINTFLIGESLMREKNIGAKLREIIG